MNTICREILSLIEMTSSSISSMVHKSCTKLIEENTEFYQCYCWWFKNPKANHLGWGCIPNPSFDQRDFNYQPGNLNWWVDRFLVGSINSWKVGHMDPVNWASGRHVQRLIWIPFHHVGHLMGKWCSSFWLDRKIMSKKQHMIRYPGVFEQQITILKVIYFRIYSWYIFLSKYYIYMDDFLEECYTSEAPLARPFLPGGIQ